VSVGDRLSAIAALGDGARVERGEIRLGRGRALLPEHAGVRVAGTADRLDVDAWKRVIETGAAETGALTGVTGIDVSLGQLDAFGRSYHQMRLSATRDEGMWTADVKSREMAGKIVVPPEEDAEWRADLQYLNIEKTAENAAESTLDPRALPALSATSEQFRYGDTDFGRLVLKASRRPDGMSLDQLVLSSGRMQVEAKGAWVVADEHQVSSFDISFSSPDFGKALSALGYAGSIAEGKAGGSIKARWIGGPTAFSLERMDGAMDLDVSDGRLLDVEPGAGRIFGLISLQAFPRRLALDFSDFYGKGFGFDRITGHFTIKDGVANTTDLTMTGPAARITARGDINLAARQYDQIVVVTPNVTSGLPVAGAVAGGVAAGAVTGGLGLGAAIFLMERALRGDIDRMTKITYHVLGPWNDPVIVRLQDKEER
jgi:uncharacterized protein YhdP